MPSRSRKGLSELWEPEDLDSMVTNLEIAAILSGHPVGFNPVCRANAQLTMTRGKRDAEFLPRIDMSGDSELS